MILETDSPPDGGSAGIVGVASKTPIDTSPLRRPGRGIGRVAPAVRPPHLERVRSPYRLLLLVPCAVGTDDFSASNPGFLGIQNITRAVIYAFRNRHHALFAPEAPGTPGPVDLLLLGLTGDSLKLSCECLERPGGYTV